MFHDPVRVPEDVGTGTAKVTVTFAEWKGAKIAPLTLVVPVKDPEPAKSK